MLDRFNREPSYAPSTAREVTIPRFPAGETSRLCVWDVKLHLGAVIVLIIVVWLPAPSVLPTEVYGAVVTAIAALVCRSTLHHMRLLRS